MSYQPPNSPHSTNATWRRVLRVIRDEGAWVEGVRDNTSPGSGFGEHPRPYRELLGYIFILDCPRDRVIQSAVRPVDLQYAIANTIWVLTGSADLSMIEAYNSRGRSFSDDGSQLAGAAGPRMFSRPLQTSPFGRIINLLRRDPTSRRALVPLYWPGDAGAFSRDVPCTADVHFLYRNGALQCITHMRSQSALGVLPYDLFLLTMVHEVVATTLGVPLGKYVHFCSSLHYYEEESELVDAVVAESPVASREPMRPMPLFDDELAEKLARLEEMLRPEQTKDTLQSAPSEISEMEDMIGPYWSKLLAFMCGRYLEKNLFSEGSGIIL